MGDWSASTAGHSQPPTTRTEMMWQRAHHHQQQCPQHDWLPPPKMTAHKQPRKWCTNNALTHGHNNKVRPGTIVNGYPPTTITGCPQRQQQMPSTMQGDGACRRRHGSVPHRPDSWETWCLRNEERATHEMNWCMSTETNTHTHTTLTHTSLLYVHRVSSSSSLGILLNTQMLCLNKSSTELIEFAKFLF